MLSHFGAAIKRFKIVKSAGHTGVVSEMMKSSGGFGTRWMTDLINNIVKEDWITDDWRKGILVPVYKGKCDPLMCGSYRAIRLLKQAMKVLEQQMKVLERRLDVKCQLLYASCVRSSMPYGSETMPLLQMIRWMCSISMKDRSTSEELRRLVGVAYHKCN